MYRLPIYLSVMFGCIRMLLFIVLWASLPDTNKYDLI